MFASTAVGGAAPLALVAAALLAWGAGAAALPTARRGERWLAGSLLTAWYVVVGVRALAQLGWLGRESMLAWWATGGLVGAVLGWRWRRARRTSSAAVGRPPSVPRALWPLLGVAVGALAWALLAAYLLPIWQFDAAGYHLPLVNYLLERGRLSDVPPDAPFLSSYPRHVEYIYAGFRALMPDDTWIDAAQLVWLPTAIAATALLARGFGARPAPAWAAGVCLWLTPAAYLVSVSNYVDFAAAAWLLAAMACAQRAASGRWLALCALALGLLLGTKLNAPLPCALVFAWAGWRFSRRRGVRRAAAPWLCAGAAALAIGCEVYVTNWLRHGNPLWPVQLHLGPWQLPGTWSVDRLLAAGANMPRVHGPLPWRLVRSWTATLEPLPRFDMRYGGFGLVFCAALVAGLVRLWRRRDRALWLQVGVFSAAALSSPDPAWARFVLAFVGVVLALGASAWPRTERAQRPLFGALAALSALQLLWAAPGLRGDGPPLRAMWALSPHERRAVLGPEGPARPWMHALAELPPSATVAFDGSMELPYLLWRPDLQGRVLRLPDASSPESVAAWLRAHDVKLLVAGDDWPAGHLAKQQPARFVEWFRCPYARCSVFRL